MAEKLPVRKYFKVRVIRRKNNPRMGGREPTVSYTLRWKVNGRKYVRSLGPVATLAFAKRMAAEKEKEANGESHSNTLAPCTRAVFRRRYLATFFPGHVLPTTERQEAHKQWA
ncbi:MAG: hypothetical protein U0840_24955 [Gemmataceae bacterium]